MKLPGTTLLFAFILCLLIACQNTTTNEESKQASVNLRTIGTIQRNDDAMKAIVPGNAKIEILAEGFSWAEGPVWVPKLNALLFTDVPNNTIHRWSENEGLATYLNPSGHTGYAISSATEGANGLILDNEGKLMMAQHGDRRIARMMAPLDSPKASFETVIDNYADNLFNSPNDLCLASNGDLYFTDPPYGLDKQDEDSLKALKFNGVYKLSASGELTLLTNELTRPNGIALSPDEKILYVANSDSKRAIWMAYDVIESGVENGRLFFDATEKLENLKGLPDGLKVDRNGNIFATGPGGVLVFTPDGIHLGTIMTEFPTANCAFNEDESALFMTTSKYLTRIKLK